MEATEIKKLLEKHFTSLEKIILSRQNPITGLLPASTAITAHGDYTDAWVRDNVYSILSVWGLSIAFSKHLPLDVRGTLLRQSVVKLMRGLLASMMHQSHKVEAYKKSRNPLDALHAKYATKTGLSVVGDDAWGHLQLDATSLFLLMLAQMSASGLKIIYTLDEVAFVQNLVHYISRTYATPDYGIWERGNKINHGTAEINASSVGMAKAALEAMDGFNFFQESDSFLGFIHVVPNDIARSRLTLESLLPRESNSKESDAALLSIIGYPAYAVEDEALAEKTREKIIEKLVGNYGAKRFLLDGHQSVLEDGSRLHYEPSELREFARVESEWPLFFTYFLLDALMRGKRDEAKRWQERLLPLFVEEDGEMLLPELYYVPQESIKAEKATPHSQKRLANENLPLVWAQSLYMLSLMLEEKILEPKDIDPLKRRERLGTSTLTTPLLCVISENKNVQNALNARGIESQTLQNVAPFEVMHASELSKIHATLGANTKLGLSGREYFVARSATTSRLHNINEKQILFLPYYFNPKSFYFGFDNNLLVEHYRSSVRFIAKTCRDEKAPIVAFFVREDMLRDHSREVIVELLLELENSSCKKVKTKKVTLQEAFLQAQMVKIESFSLNLENLGCDKEEREKEPYELAAIEHNWTEVRLLAQKNAMYDIRIEDALMDILTAQKRLSVGRSYSDGSIIEKPIEAIAIVEKIRKYCGENRAERALTQEIILHLGHLIRSEPQLFSTILTLRTWDAIQLLVGHISREKALTLSDAYEELLRYAPHGIYDTLRFIYSSYTQEIKKLKELENLCISGVECLDIQLQTQESVESVNEDWVLWREKSGRIAALREGFYEDVWHLLEHCKGLIVGDKYSLQSRIGAELILESTAGERSFELKIENLLQSISIASYKKLNLELIETLIKLFNANPELTIENDLVLDVIIGHSVRIAWMRDHMEMRYEEYKGEAWSAFYTYSPQEVEESFLEALSFLIEEGSRV